MVRRGLAPGRGQAGALEGVDEGEAVAASSARATSVRRRVLGDGQQHLLAQPGDLLAEQRGRGLLALGHLGLAVHQGDHGAGQGPLGGAPLRVLRRLGVEGLDLVVGEEGEVAQAAARPCSSAVLKKNWYMAKGLVRAGSSQTVPDLGLAELGAVGLERRSGVVRPQTSSPQTLRMRSMPMVMLPHWSLPPIWRSQPWSTCRRRKS